MTLASTTITLVPNHLGGVGQRRPAAAAMLDTVEDFVQCGLTGLLDQMRQQVFLKGTVFLRRSLSEDSVGLFRDVLDLDRWHGAIMAPSPPPCNRL